VNNRTWMSAASVVAVLVMACTAACGSDDSSDTRPSDGGAPDGTTTVAEAGAGEDAGGVTGSITSCLVGSTSTSALPAGCSALEQCLQTNCNADFVAAFGADWASGTVAGACQTFYTCASAAGCGQSAITGCLPSAGAACDGTLEGVSSCLQDSCASEGAACNAALGSPLDAGNVGAGDASMGADAN
jgi:hypothetical protein